MILLSLLVFLVPRDGSDESSTARRAYPFELSSSFFKGAAKVALNCAHRTSTF